MKVAFCAAEVFPFAKTGGLADVAGTLPVALQKHGIDVDIFLPKYGFIDEKKYGLKRIDEYLYLSKISRGVNVYFLDNEPLFGRKEIYGGAYGDYADNLERFQYFSLELLYAFKRLKKKFDIVHCHDWHTALIPVYLKERFRKDPFYARTKTVLTIHNLAFQGIFPKGQWPMTTLEVKDFRLRGFEHDGAINLLKAGICQSDMITTVSQQYAKEIQQKAFGCGLEKVLRKRRKKLKGIVNGIDVIYWNPRSDPFIARQYSASSFAAGKRENKDFLQKKFGLSRDPHRPLLSYVSRLTEQKGIDLILEAMDELLSYGVQFIFQGMGDKKFSQQLVQMAKQYPQQVAYHFEFSEKMAHQIYAGSDIFLMPSRFEPCGLSQMISLRYGTPPVVFRTGGLADTVTQYDDRRATGYGFVFKRYTKEDFIKSVKEAVDLYHEKKVFGRLIQNGFKKDFSWDHSARDYERLYRCLLSA